MTFVHCFHAFCFKIKKKGFFLYKNEFLLSILLNITYVKSTANQKFNRFTKIGCKTEVLAFLSS